MVPVPPPQHEDFVLVPAQGMGRPRVGGSRWLPGRARWAKGHVGAAGLKAPAGEQ